MTNGEERQTEKKDKRRRKTNGEERQTEKIGIRREREDKETETRLYVTPHGGLPIPRRCWDLMWYFQDIGSHCVVGLILIWSDAVVCMTRCDTKSVFNVTRPLRRIGRTIVVKVGHT
jgi:hypothetical protein